ncbi:MAG: hypothetical protein B7Z20_00520 [Sphingobium sp. 32-64-5]|nr:MAG: hypothetical protein B7Z20_00520 [Sphingobium sp. 32-64-5]
MRPATARSGQALPVHATRPAAAITATLASASLRLNSQIARTLASPSRKRASTKADTTLIASATTPIVPISSASGAVAFRARQIAKPITPTPSAPRNNPCVSATFALARHRFGTTGYAEHYTRRVMEMAGHATQSGARAIWLGLPNMREAQFAGAVRQLNAIQQAAAETAGAVWVDTWEATSDAEGRYLPAVGEPSAARTFRAEDGVHFTGWGYLRIGSLLFDQAAAHFPDLAPGLGRLAEA